MLSVLFVFLLLLVPGLTWGAVINAASCSVGDIQAAHTAAASGDTIQLPSCTQNTWTGMVTITKAVTIQGTGTGTTILNRSSVSATWPDPGALGSGNPMFLVTNVTGFTMTALTLDGTRDTDPNVYKDRGIYLSNCVDFRLHDLALNDFAIAIHVQGDPLVQRGLIDHNTFANNSYIVPAVTSLGYGVMVFGNGTYPSLALGTAQNIFVEDNIFTGSKHDIASNNGSRYVFRHNTSTETGTATFAAWDAHGLLDWPAGSRQYEIYENSLTNSTEKLAAYVIRGGDGVIFNNSTIGDFVNLECWLTNESCSGTYPRPQQVRELYFWNNTRTGGASARIFNTCTSLLQLNRDYFTVARPGYVPFTYPHPQQGGQASVPDFTSTLTMHLKLDEGTGTTAQDSTINNHDGTLDTGATWGPATMGTSAVALDGTTDGVVTVSGLLGSPAAVTLAAWIKLAAFPTGSAEVLSLGDHVVLRVSATTLLGFYSSSPTSWVNLSAPRTLGTTAWHHLAYTAEVGAQRLYLDGALIATGNSTTPLSYAGLGGGTVIGGHGAGATTFRLQGAVDDVRAYGRALSPTDIAGLAALADPPPLSILITTPTTSASTSTSAALLANVGGTASGNTGVTGITWTCPTCTTTTGAATCTPACAADATAVNWNIPALTFPVAGTHLLTVAATDASSPPPATDTLTVTYTPPATGGGAACTHYASPSGGGNGLSQGSPFQIVNFWAVATPGKVLCLLDGTYTGGNSWIKPPTTFAGTASQPITIRALNDGKVLIDGGYGSRPVGLVGSYGILEGINAHGGDNVTFSMAGDHWIARRVVVWNNRPTNSVANVDNMLSVGGTNNVLEDCAAFGIGRKVISVGPGKIGPGNNTVRRCWARFENKGFINPPGVGGPPTVSYELGYKQDSVLFENVLGTREMTPGAQNTAPEPTFAVFMSDNSRVLGSISYVRPGVDFGAAGMFITYGDLENSGEIFTTRNILFKDIVTYGQGYTIRPFQFIANTTNGHTITNLVGVSGNPTTCDTQGYNSCSNIRYGTTLANAIGAGNSIWTQVPGICKRYVNGALTTQGLWPWPMNQRISDALAQSGRARVDITATMQSFFGTIPASCQTEAVAEVCTPPLVGTPPNCACPAGTVPPNCDPETPPVTCPPDCPVQDVFVIAPAGSSPAGNDANTCTLAAPCLTINRARSLMTPGDTLYLRAGTYTGTGNRITTSTGPFPAGGTWSTATKIAAYGEEAVVLQQATGTVVTLNNPATDRYLILDRLIVDGATTGGNDTQGLIVSSGAHHIRFQNGTLRNCHFEALTISNANSVEILNTVIHGTSHTQGAVIQGTSDGVVLEGVTVHSNASAGLNASSSGLTNLTLRNTTSRNNVGTGFFLGATNLLATNLLAYGNALGVRLTALTVDARLYNATVADNSGAEVQIDAGATGTLVVNTLAVGGITDAGTGTVLTTNYTGDPNFVGGGNYRLASADSPAADAGTDLSAVFSTAIDGITRPVGEAWDIGSYERSGSGGVLPTPGALSAAPCCGALHFLVP